MSTPDEKGAPDRRTPGRRDGSPPSRSYHGELSPEPEQTIRFLRFWRPGGPWDLIAEGGERRRFCPQHKEEMLAWIRVRNVEHRLNVFYDRGPPPTGELLLRAMALAQALGGRVGFGPGPLVGTISYDPPFGPVVVRIVDMNPERTYSLEAFPIPEGRWQ
jgi:hypothetical protein